MAAPELLCRDVFPSEVLLPDGRLLLEARAFVTNRRLLVWKVADGRVRQVVEMALAGEPIRPRRDSLNGHHLELETTDGIVLVNQGHVCGCGSPLKALAPPVGWTRREAA
jgi:hypothetical protein